MKRILFSTLLVLGSYGTVNFLERNVVEKIPSTLSNRVDETGKVLDAPKIAAKTFYSLEEEYVRIPHPSRSLTQTIDKQITILRRKRPFKAQPKFTGLKMNQTALRKKLLETAEKLRKWTDEGADEATFHEQFELYKVNGFDQRGNIQFTAYYTPIFNVRTTSDEDFQYPIIKVLPTKDSITNKRLTETVWTDDPKTAAAIRMQGSGFIKYSNGQKELLNFNRELVKQAQLPKDNVVGENVFVQYFNYPKGSTGVPLTPQHSIAVDPTLIPYGSCLLSATPVIGSNGKFVRHEYKLLFAQDTGSFIKGMHVDYYTGVGDEALRQARLMRHYGKMWLIMAKDEVTEKQAKL
jgi:membrane-bound lytic murein transglycosylase A